jgi:hypothetical protein
MLLLADHPLAVEQLHCGSRYHPLVPHLSRLCRLCMQSMETPASLWCIDSIMYFAKTSVSMSHAEGQWAPHACLFARKCPSGPSGLSVQQGICQSFS